MSVTLIPNSSAIPRKRSLFHGQIELVIRGKQTESTDKTFLHRGIAARQFQRSFVLAEGIEVTGAELKNGLLAIELTRPKAENVVRTIKITAGDDQSATGATKPRPAQGGLS